MWIFYINCCAVVDDFLDKNKILILKNKKLEVNGKKAEKTLNKFIMREIKIRLTQMKIIEVLIINLSSN